MSDKSSQIPPLKLLDKFNEIISSYKPSKEAIELLDNAELVILQSMAAGGRNTIIKELEKTGLYKFFPSDTTRPPRENNGIMEQSGVEYFFVSEEDFIEGLEKGEYLEAELIHNQQFSGISVRELRKIYNSGKIGINEVGYLGAMNIHKLSDNPFIIFVLPPSYEAWMERWKKRGKISDQEFKNRMVSAQKELEAAVQENYFKFVINDDLGKAVLDLRRIIEDGDYSKKEHEDGLAIAQDILDKVKEKLATL